MAFPMIWILWAFMLLTHGALAHWAKDAGHRQLCGDLSGQVIIDFVKKYPESNTQEPGAA